MCRMLFLTLAFKIAYRNVRYSNMICHNENLPPRHTQNRHLALNRTKVGYQCVRYRRMVQVVFFCPCARKMCVRVLLVWDHTHTHRHTLGTSPRHHHSIEIYTGEYCFCNKFKFSTFNVVLLLFQCQWIYTKQKKTMKLVWVQFLCPFATKSHNLNRFYMYNVYNVVCEWQAYVEK